MSDRHPPHGHPHGQAPVRHLGDGVEDHLVPLKALDPLDLKSFDALARAMSQTAFGGRSVGEACDVLEAMVKDPDCLVVATFSGAMTVAKMSLVIVRMIEAGMIDAIVSTGALMAHGLSEAVGLTHYKVNPGVSDEVYFEKGYNRVYDTLEMEKNLNAIDEFVRAQLDLLDASATGPQAAPNPGGLVPTQPWSSEMICRHLGKALADMGESPGILRSAYLKNVPVFVPAFTDSEMGLDVATWMLRRTHAKAGGKPDWKPFENAEAPSYNPFLDLMSYARFVRKKKRLGIFTIGGGVPRNWAQQVAPFYDIVEHRLGVELDHPRFTYGVRICPEPVHWGGLSGCTYSEGVSWGKFVPPSEGGRFAEVYADATIAWPLIARAVMERLGKV
jgi:deoxyhypusine synthase